MLIRDINFDEKTHLVEFLLACPHISDENDRRLLLTELPYEISNAIKAGDTAKVHVLNIVNACITHEGGFEAFIEVLRFFDGKTAPFKRLNKFISSLYGNKTVQMTDKDKPPRIGNQVDSKETEIFPDITDGSSRSSAYTTACFVYVAACADEFKKKEIKQKIEAYYNGDECAKEWKPYWPADNDSIGIIAQRVATNKKFHYDYLSLPDNQKNGCLIKKLEDVEKENKIVIIILDPWSLMLPKYAKIIKEYDRRDFYHCTLMILFNHEDQDTKHSYRELKRKINETFPTKIITKSYYFRGEVLSVRQLKRELARALREIRANIREYGEIIRAVSGDGFTQKPTISINMEN